MKRFSELTEQEILALAIGMEEEDARIYTNYAKGLEENYPASAKVFTEMAREEDHHRQRLIELHRKKFGEHIPLIRRQDVSGFVSHRPLWMVRPLGLDTVRKQAEIMECETRRFYERAMERTSDAGVRKLLGDLAQAERGHETLAARLGEKILNRDTLKEEEETRRRLFVLQVVQPGLAGLMDGSVSTLAPLFAAAFATHNTWETFLVGMAASVGAGISMGFAEALSDDGALDRPWPPADPRRHHRRHDGARRRRSHAALLDREFPAGDDGRLRRGGGRAVGHCLDPLALYGHALPAGGVRDRARRRHRVRRRHPHRQRLSDPP